MMLFYALIVISTSILVGYLTTYLLFLILKLRTRLKGGMRKPVIIARSAPGKAGAVDALRVVR
jgi:hypothetical protein